MRDRVTSCSGPRSGADALSVFGEIRAVEARSLAGPVLEVEVESGSELIRQGETVGTFFVIRSGNAQLSHEGRTIGSPLCAGHCFGEVDPDSQRAQEFSVTAISPMRLLTFSALGIARLCAEFPGMRQRLVAELPGG
jgi:CRP-like cAMP-binding protein